MTGDVVAHLGNVLVIARRLYVDDEAFSIGSADNPPIRENRIDEGKQYDAPIAKRSGLPA